jgi:hypothetical protein
MPGASQPRTTTLRPGTIGLRHGTTTIRHISDGLRRRVKPLRRISDGLRPRAKPLRRISEGLRHRTKPLRRRLTTLRPRRRLLAIRRRLSAIRRRASAIGRSHFHLRRKCLKTGRNCGDRRVIHGGRHPCLPVGRFPSHSLPKRGSDAALTGNQARLPPRRAGRSVAATRQAVAVLKEMVTNVAFYRKPLRPTIAQPFRAGTRGPQMPKSRQGRKKTACRPSRDLEIGGGHFHPVLKHWAIFKACALVAVVPI